MRPVGILVVLAAFAVVIFGVATSQLGWFLAGALAAIPGAILWALGAALHTRLHGDWSPLVLSRRQGGAAAA